MKEPKLTLTLPKYLRWEHFTEWYSIEYPELDWETITKILRSNHPHGFAIGDRYEYK